MAWRTMQGNIDTSKPAQSASGDWTGAGTQATEPPDLTSAAAHGPATTAFFKTQPNAAALPPPAANPNAMTSNNSNINGMSSEGGGQAAIDLKNGGLYRNEAWRNTNTGSANIMAPNDSVTASPNFQGNKYGFGGTLLEGNAAGGGGNGEVWGGQQGQGYRQQLTDMMHTALTNSQQRTAVPGFNGTTIGASPEHLQMANTLASILGGSFTAQGQERAAMGELGLKGGELGIKQAALPSEIAKNVAAAGYFGAHGEALGQNAEARQQIANQQLEIAGLKAGAGKYGDVNIAAEELRSKGISPTPQNIEAFNAGHKIVPGTPATKGSAWRNIVPGVASNATAAVPAHMVPPDARTLSRGNWLLRVRQYPI